MSGLKRLEGLLEWFICLLFGHRADIKTKKEEMVRKHHLEGFVSYELRMVERIRCSRCGEEVAVKLVDL